MRLKKSIQLALNILLHSKLRSWLTIIGIIIGIAAVVSIVSISQGAQQQLNERLGDFGADILTVSPGFSRARGAGGGFRGTPGMDIFGQSTVRSQKNLTIKDVIILRGISNVKYVAGEVSGRSELSYASKTASTSIKGVDTSVWKDITTEVIDSGRLLSKGDSYSVVLGGRLVESTFEGEIKLNDKVTIGGKLYKVVGILTEGSSVYIPIEIARTSLEGIGDEKFDSISVKINEILLADETVESITRKLMVSRGILKESDKDFTVTNPAEFQENIQQTMDTMGLFLGAIAAISLLVGAIGIANTMFTSVLEKTKEIGIMKAIGAQNKDILLIFLINSGMIGLVGGVGGVILGVVGSGLIDMWGSSMSGGGMTRMMGNTAITPELLIGSLLFSVIIGMIAGVVPAYRASKLDPVDALRYE